MVTGKGLRKIETPASENIKFKNPPKTLGGKEMEIH